METAGTVGRILGGEAGQAMQPTPEKKVSVFSGIGQTAAKVLMRSSQGSSEYEIACFALNVSMSVRHREQLAQLVHGGPVYDGDVISKSARDDLIDLNLATRACVRGEQGFTAANYRGWDVLKAS